MSSSCFVPRQEQKVCIQAMSVARGLICQLGCQQVTHLQQKSGSVIQKKNGESSGPCFSECVTLPGDVFLCRQGYRPWQKRWAELDLKSWGSLW